MNVLGIETSCDDTSLALYATDRGLVEIVTASQLVHEDFGGIVPELASRQHLRTLLAVYDTLLERAGVTGADIDGIGVSNGPGLIGSLLVGVGFAKSLAWALGIPVVGVHHIEAHVLSNELEGRPLSYPCVVLVVSGGHTALFHIPRPGQYHRVGNTRDDAAGEAFDKIAKLLGLGFPGGPAVQRVAERGRGDAVDFPRAMRGRDNFDFSFSGLKTAVRLHVESLGARPDAPAGAMAGTLDAGTVADIAASAQAAIVDVLVEKTVACARAFGVGEVYIAGGVAANGPLRHALDTACADSGITFHAPLLRFCTDNGAMVAHTAAIHLEAGRDDGHDLDVFARGPLGA